VNVKDEAQVEFEQHEEGKEAEIYIAFLRFLRDKRPDRVFNTGLCEVGTLKPFRLKQILTKKMGPDDHLHKLLEGNESEWKNHPFTIIDPFERNSLPSCNAGLCAGKPNL
jgi:hypothetical protein